MEGTDLNDGMDKLERFATASLHWTDYAVRFETSKTEAIKDVKD